MSTDLSGILKAVGVECEELEAYLAIDYEFTDKRWWEITDDAYPAFRALVNLVASERGFTEYCRKEGMVPTRNARRMWDDG